MELHICAVDSIRYYMPAYERPYCYPESGVFRKRRVPFIGDFIGRVGSFKPGSNRLLATPNPGPRRTWSRGGKRGAPHLVSEMRVRHSERSSNRLWVTPEHCFRLWVCSMSRAEGAVHLPKAGSEVPKDESDPTLLGAPKNLCRPPNHLTPSFGNQIPKRRLITFGSLK